MQFEFLDVAIGLVFVYLVLSLAVTAANELFAAAFRRRALTLRAGINHLLDDELTTRLRASADSELVPGKGRTVIYPVAKLCDCAARCARGRHHSVASRATRSPS